MYTKWTEHLTDQSEKEGFEKSVKSARPVLNRLRDILKEQDKSIDRAELNADAYDNPAWAHKQAFRNGQRAALMRLIDLVDLDQQKGTTLDPTKLIRRPARPAASN
jgi:hypothetical protein